MKNNEDFSDFGFTDEELSQNLKLLLDAKNKKMNAEINASVR